MANSIYVLSGTTNNQYTVVVHTPTPAGNNAAGISWVNAIVGSGRNKSVLSVGAGPGQITQTEMNGVLAGTIIESTMNWQDDPTMSNANRVTALNTTVAQLANATSSRWATELNYYGYTATV